MPYYSWEGVDWFGRVHHGNDLARSEDDLQQQLFKQELGLVSCKKKLPRKLFKPITAQYKYDLYKQLAILIKSGIYIDQALVLVKAQIRHEALQEIIVDLIDDLRQGQTLAHSIAHYPTYFNALTQQLLASGQESGTLAAALEHLADYEETVAEFHKKIRSAILLPCITFTFFSIISAIILTVIVPRFAQLFGSLGHDVPFLTHCILSLSDYVRTYGLYLAIGMTVFFIIGLRLIKRHKKSKQFFDHLILKTPLCGSLVSSAIFTSYFKSLALLVYGGVHTVAALRLALDSVGNSAIKHSLNEILYQIEEGKTLAQAFSTAPSFFSHDSIALLSVGQESGTLYFMFTRISDLFKERVQRRLTVCATVIQPILMLVLGALITMLIVAVYVPIFNLSSVVA